MGSTASTVTVCGEGCVRLGLFVFPALLLGAAMANAQDATVYSPGKGVSTPTLVKVVHPMYTPEAMAAKIEGRVVVAAVVQTDGTVANVKVVQSLDPRFGLDQQVVNAAKQWVFKPGLKDGIPVAVRITIEEAFTMHVPRRGYQSRR
jgi:TonB family protein